MKCDIFLTSSISYVANNIPRFLDHPAGKYKLLFIYTAAEVEKGDVQWLKDDRNSLKKAGFHVEGYTITGKKLDEIKAKLEDTDIIYLSGGNQFYLLFKMQETGCKKLIADMVKMGKIYMGGSAGSIIAGPGIRVTRLIDEAEKGGTLRSYEGLGLVDFTVLPHWGSEDFREIYLNQRLETAYSSKNSKLILLRDNQYIVVKNGWNQIISV